VVEVRRHFPIVQPSVILLVVAAAVMLAILLYVGRWMLFWWDEWGFIFERPDPTPDALLAPVFDTFAGVPILVYEGLLAVFGLKSYLPYLLVAWAAHFAIAFLLFRVIQRRSGAVVAVPAALSVIFLGSGYEVLLQPFQIQYLFAFVGGLAAVDLLDTNRPRLAAVALLPAVASSGLGVILAGAILAWGLLRRDRRSLLATTPAIAVYAAWYLTWGQQSEHLAGAGLTPLEAVASVLLGMGAAMSGIMGLPPSHFASVGLAILGVALCAVGLFAIRGHRPDSLAIAALIALAATEVLRVIFRGQYGVEYGANRSGYVYISAVLLWLVIGGLAKKPLPSTRTVRMATIVLLTPMLLLNMWQFAEAANHHRALRATMLAELRLIESQRDNPRLALDAHLDDVGAIYVQVAPYLSASDRFGRPDLDYDWQPYVDVDLVDAARERLLPSPVGGEGSMTDGAARTGWRQEVGDL
jgi:hypothetical protein